jgi:DNA invertase Pin-like site-specific DNA recombinase
MAQAVAYLRVSGQGQIDGDGFDRQTDAIRAYARKARLRIADEDWFRDAGVSGTRELENRPALAALLDRVESNGVRIVIVERADRLARDLMVSEIILSKFREAGVKVFSADGVELTADDDPARGLIRQVLAAVAEYDKRVTVLKLRAARERIRRRGETCEGRKPYGHHPAEQDVVALMKQLRRKTPKGPRRSYAAIAEELNARDIPTRTGGKWQPRTVCGILSRGATSA